jgi:hypothetical protein
VTKSDREDGLGQLVRFGHLEQGLTGTALEGYLNLFRYSEDDLGQFVNLNCQASVVYLTGSAGAELDN